MQNAPKTLYSEIKFHPTLYINSIHLNLLYEIL
jgi:hypothetical protein